MWNWILRVFQSLFRNATSQSSYERDDFVAATEAYNNLMNHYQRQYQGMVEEMEQLRGQVASLSSALETEQRLRRECQTRLNEHEGQLKALTARLNAITGGS